MNMNVNILYIIIILNQVCILLVTASSHDEASKPCLTGPCTEHGVKYTVYLISVTKQYYGSQAVEKWDVCRRYSDFHDFHMMLQEKVTLTDCS